MKIELNKTHSKYYFKPIFHCLVLSIFFVAYIFTQEVNENFIKSLPSNIQKDFLSQLENDELAKDKFYRAPDTSILDIETSISQMETKIQDIRDSLDEESEKEKVALKRYGSSFFQSFQSSFSPINIPNLDPSYILDIGDILNIQLSGQKNFSEKVLIQRDGSISIPEVGKVNIAGLTLQKASDAISNKVSLTFIGVSADISLANLRDINILVVGQVNNPGIYTLSGGASILTAINAAGGITDKGSYRAISHKRNSITIKEIDLYKLFSGGEYNFDNNLRSGDIIFIPPAMPSISVTGAVTNEAIFEIKEGETLYDIYNIAGHSNALTHTEAFFFDYSLQENKLISIHEMNKIYPESNDQIKISKYEFLPEKDLSVTITGAIKNPGTYSVRPGTKFSSLVELAGGYLPFAQEFRGVLQRNSTKEYQKEFNDRAYNQIISFILTNQTPSASNQSNAFSQYDSLIFLLSQYKEQDFYGRAVIEFDLQKIKKDPSLDTYLEDGDNIFIPRVTTDIIIAGDVFSPGARRYHAGANVEQYIESAGGLNKYADSKRIVIVKPNGETELHSPSSFFLKQSDILPGTLIYVPREIGSLRGLPYAATIAPIISSLALSLASLNAIN